MTDDLTRSFAVYLGRRPRPRHPAIDDRRHRACMSSHRLSLLLRVLAVLSSPADLPPLNMEREWRAIQDTLAGLTADGKFVLERLATPSMVPGDVWYVLQGPVCADGINWYSVGAYDAGGWTAEGQPGRGYYLGRTNRLPGGEGAVTPVCASDRLSIGMRAMVGDGRNQRVRPQPSKAAREIAWLAPGVPVTLLDGPSCADGWIWWYIRDDSGRIQGWTAEGDGPARPWLVRLGAADRAALAAWRRPRRPGPAAIRPTFTGSLATSWTLTPANHQTSFSLDQEAVTVFFSDFAVRAPAGGSQARRVETLTLPVRSGPRGYVAGAMILGFVDCTGGGRATLTLQAGNASNTVTCQDANSGEVIVRVAQPANADLRIVITAQVWKSGPGAEPSVNVDLIDIGLEPR